MAEEIKNETVEEVVNEEVDTQETTEQQEEMIPKSQMEKIIKDRVAREKKATEKAVEEAKRLAKMNEDEKQQYELEQLQKELEEYKRKDSHYSMSKEATKMLSEKGIPADDEVFEVVVKDTAEDTKNKVEWFSGLVNRLVEEGVKKTLSGNPPRANVNGSNALTKEKIMQEKDASKRIRLIQENPHLFK